MIRTLPVLFAAVCLMMSSAIEPASAQDSEVTPAAVELSPQRVTLFKNGYGIVLSKTTLPGEAGPVRIDALPKSTLGSFWLGWDSAMELADIVARHAEVSEEKPAATIQRMLEANIGKQVSVKVGDDWISGQLIAMPEQDDQWQVQTGRGGNIIFPPPRPVAQTLLIKTQDGLSVLRTGAVEQLRLPMDAKTVFEQVTQKPVLDLSVTKPADDTTLWLEHMARGITWSPSYRVDITDDETARITAKAVVINDLMDMKDVTVELVTGYPHLKHVGGTSGMWLVPMDQFIQAMNRQGGSRANITMNIMGQQALSNTSSGFYNAPAVPVPGQSTEDLYFYPLENVTLAKGERGYFPLFSEAVPYEHCYTWDIEDYVDSNNRYRNRNRNDQGDAEIVWHAISLKNETDFPWTTAPGQTVKGSRLLGQDTLHYTPVGGSTDLRITQALSVVAEQNEYEVERQRNAQQFYGSRYDKVTVRGELAVTNRVGKDITLRITKQLSGEVVATEGEPTVNKLGTGLRSVNPRSELVWQVPLPAGAKEPVKLTYRYTVFVRN